ncbi:MAG: hypothetical protein LBB89_00265 [Treponema sp.]|nr:hypothetical protein [Treponema sp.]
MNKTLKKMALITVMAAVIAAACSNESDSPQRPPTPNVSAGVSGSANPTLASGLTISLTGSATVQSGNIASTEWSLKSAPVASVTFADKTSPNTTVTGITKSGAYVFELKATSSAGVPGTKTVTVNVAPMKKSITVPAINNPITDPWNFGAVSTLSGWDTNFPATDVTYTLTLSQGDVTKKTVTSTSATSISGSGLADGQYTITQTFLYKGSPIPNGSRSAGVVIAGNIIAGIIVDENTLVAGNLTELILNLSRDSL